MSQQEEKYVEKNAEYIENQAVYSGILIDGDKLRNQMSSGEKNIEIAGERVTLDKSMIDPIMVLNRSDKGYYFYNELKVGYNDEEKGRTENQSFKITNGKLFHLGDCKKLLDGKSICQEIMVDDKENPGKKVAKDVWLYLEFKERDESGAIMMRRFNYDLEAHLQKEGIKDFNIPQVRIDIVSAMKRGISKQVLISNGNGFEKRILEAAPKYNGLNRYNDSMQRIRPVIEKDNNVTNDVQSTNKKRNQRKSV